MPKININEYDNTKPLTAGYESFAVVVPGAYITEKISNEDPFDENGIYECTSQTEFEDKIGLVAPQPVTAEQPAKAAEVSNLSDTEGTTVYAKRMTANEYGNYFLQNTLYTRVALASNPGDKKALCALDTNDDKWYKYTAVTEFNFEEDEEDHLSITSYSVIERGKEGNDKAEAVDIAHYGNQLAYLLLGLGYKVLYKKLFGVAQASAKTAAGAITTSALTDLANFCWWEELTDKAAYDFRYIINGLLTNNRAANEAISKVATAINDKNAFSKEARENNGRGDCIALLDIDKAAYEGLAQMAAVAGIKNEVSEHAGNIVGKYAAFFAPYVDYSGVESRSEFCNNKRLPASFHYLACAARAFENYDPWFAVSGYERGVSDLSIAATGCKFGDRAINSLQKRFAVSDLNKAVNIIANIRGNYYLWGNRTANTLGEELVASDFLNIRQLCCTLKKVIYNACRKYTFDPNSDVLWINFCNAIKPTLEKMLGNEGIKAYKLIKVKSSKKALLAAKVRIVPIEAVEDFDINIYLEDSIVGVDVDEDVASE